MEVKLASLTDFFYSGPMDNIENEKEIHELVTSIGLLIRRLRSAAPPELSEFSWTQKAVITRLEKEGPMTTADLARAEGVKPQSMGTSVTTLEEMGLVERKPHPTDGRQFLIKLTNKGTALRKTYRDARTIWLAEAMEKISKQDRATLFEAGEIIKHLVEL